MNDITFLRIVERRFAKFLLGIALVLCGFVSLRAGDSKEAPTPAPEEEELKNWIELGIGGLIVHGDEAQFKQQHGISGDVFGGIEDMHYEQTFDKNGTFSIDGHAIFDNHDY